MHYAPARVGEKSMKTIMVIEGKLREEGTERKRIESKRAEKQKLTDPTLAYLV